MKKALGLLAVLIVTIVFSRYFEKTLLRWVCAGQPVFVTTVSDPLDLWVAMAVPFCSCMVLIAGYALYGQRYSLWIRLVITIVPMLIVGGIASFLKKAQLRTAASMVNDIFGQQTFFPLHSVGLQTIPWAAFVSGIVAMLISILAGIRQGQGRPSTGGNADPPRASA